MTQIDFKIIIQCFLNEIKAASEWTIARSQRETFLGLNFGPIDEIEKFN